MTITVQQMIESQAILGATIKQLYEKPSDFLSLAYEDHALALRYAQAFTKNQSVTLLKNAYASFLPIITRLINIVPRVEGIRPYVNKSFHLPNNTDEILNVMKSFIQELDEKIDNTDFYTGLYYRGRRVATGNVGFVFRPEDIYFTHVEWENDDNNGVHLRMTNNRGKEYHFGLKTIQKMYDAYFNSKYESEWPSRENERIYEETKKLKNTYENIAEVLLLKIDKDEQQLGILDGELHKPTGSYSRLPSSAHVETLLDNLLLSGNVVLIGIIISLLSPTRSMHELIKIRSTKTTLFFLIIDHIPLSIIPAEYVIEKLCSLNLELLESTMIRVNFDVLARFASKSMILAQRLYDINPELMKTQYPISARLFTMQNVVSIDQKRIEYSNQI